MKKYTLTSETKEICGATLHRIKALKNFDTIRQGEVGGWIEQEENLSHSGNCWVYDEAMIFDKAEIYGQAMVFDKAEIYGRAKVYGAALIYGQAKVFDKAEIYGQAMVCGRANVCGQAEVGGRAVICGQAEVSQKNDYLTISPIGSRHGCTTFFRTADGDIAVKCGCFLGTIEEFEKAVEKTHGDKKHGQAYRKAIELAKVQIAGGNDDDRKDNFTA